ncbi:hypothetical protein LUZ61_002891 [Rhynchospora tenuis]|uniref:Steroid nuclear receptor ligand-binding n=1 Tax=Rhynchospora tenuis TaxID=198213 RepID=A0AAD5ZJY2_9POAL|nr:hypothetical protein LUZ61_002891 [Rhynchospora tenuis]
MEVPIGFFAKLWSLLSFLPFFFLLLLLGIIKAAIIGPVAASVIFFGNSAVIIGLWPAHFLWTYYCVLKTKRIGMVLKMLILVCLPVPLLMLVPFGVLGSLLAGVGYGFFAPLLATFEGTGKNAIDKLSHYFLDGCLGTIKGSCTLVRDFTDFSFHSYFSFMDELSETIGDEEAPIDVKFLELPTSLLVSALAIPLGVIVITGVALLKSPLMLLKGWHRLFQDLIGREGPFLETVCVPFAGLAILLWPLAVVGSVIASFICSFFLGLYAGVIAYQEESFRMGLAYMVSIVSMFDEYTNDLLYLREGSCLPRPAYRKSQIAERKDAMKNNKDMHTTIENDNARKTANKRRLGPARTRSIIKNSIQQLKPIQVWDWLFRSCELNGKVLLTEGLISVEDINACVNKGKCKKLSLSLPAWCILQCLIRSARCDSHGLMISDEVEVTNFTWPEDKVLNWLLGPLLIIKEQIRSMELTEEEEACLRKLVMTNKNEIPEDWDETGYPSSDNVRRAQLQAIIRRLQGIVANMTRMPTFRRRFVNLVKALYLDTVSDDAVQDSVSSKSQDSIDFTQVESENNHTDRELNNGDIV